MLLHLELAKPKDPPSKERRKECFHGSTQLIEKMIHTCTGLCKLFVNKLCSGSVVFPFDNTGSVVGFTLAEVEEQRRACRGCIREHGPDTLVAEQNKNKHDLIRKRSREKGVGKERERR